MKLHKYRLKFVDIHLQRNSKWMEKQIRSFQEH